MDLLIQAKMLEYARVVCTCKKFPEPRSKKFDNTTDLKIIKKVLPMKFKEYGAINIRILKEVYHLVSTLNS